MIIHVYTFVDSREPDRYESFKLFMRLEDAEEMRNSMGSDREWFDIHEVKVIT
jgi:hypothetical protein